MLRGNHKDKVLLSNLRDRGPDGHRGTREALEIWSAPSASFQRALATVRPLAAGLSSRKCVLPVSGLPEARGHYTLQEPRAIKQTWWVSSFGTSESPKLKSYPQKLGRWLRRKALPV